MELKFFDVILPRPLVFRPSQQKNVFFAPPNFYKKSTIFSLGATFRIRAGKFSRTTQLFAKKFSVSKVGSHRPNPCETHENHSQTRKSLKTHSDSQNPLPDPEIGPPDPEIASFRRKSLENTFFRRKSLENTFSS